MTDDFAASRQQMIESLRRAGIYDARVLAALADIPREHFIDEPLRHMAYADCALPIEMGQTISQPLMVAVMTQALRLGGHEHVLEIGTGTGYQTAVLSRLAAHVYSVERYETLARRAKRQLAQLAIENVSLSVGDGSLGWPEHSPYDRILVTAAAPQVPPLLLSQLAPRGLLVIPIGGNQQQELQIIERAPWGMRTSSLGKCVFVPLIGVHGWSE